MKYKIIEEHKNYYKVFENGKKEQIKILWGLKNENIKRISRSKRKGQ